jgi:hypothetical protein
VTQEKKTPLTREQEADEIIRRLKTPPVRPKTLDEEITEILQSEIQKEIDKEILRDLMEAYDTEKRKRTDRT